jgi:hypothetical protein
VQQPTAPSISLPKGGGAIRGIGEKFAANPVTGTGLICRIVHLDADNATISTALGTLSSG